MVNNSAYIKQQATIQFVINFLIGGAVVFFMTSGVSRVALWPDLANIETPNMAVDLLMGAFFLGLVLTLVLTPLTRSAINKGKVSVELAKGVVGMLPGPLLQRSLVLGGGFLVLFGVSTVTLLVVGDVEALSPVAFAILKAFYSAIESALVTVMIIRRVLAEPPLAGNR